MSNSLLYKLIEKDLAATEALENLLQEEARQLETRNLDGLDLLLKQKTDLLVSIESNENTRREQLKQNGFSEDTAGFRAYCLETDQQLQAQDGSQSGPALSELFTRLQEQLQRCKEFNARNGAIVHRSKNNLGRVLDILHGKGAQSRLYSSKGATLTSSESRNLGNA